MFCFGSRNNNQGDTEVFNAGERIASSELNAVNKELAQSRGVKSASECEVISFAGVWHLPSDWRDCVGLIRKFGPALNIVKILEVSNNVN